MEENEIISKLLSWCFCDVCDNYARYYKSQKCIFDNTKKTFFITLCYFSQIFLDCRRAPFIVGQLSFELLRLRKFLLEYFYFFEESLVLRQHLRRVRLLLQFHLPPLGFGKHCKSGKTANFYFQCSWNLQKNFHLVELALEGDHSLLQELLLPHHLLE